MTDWLDLALQHGRIEVADVLFARSLARIGGDPDPRVLLGAALALRAPRRGHVCVDLALAAEAEDSPDLQGWRAALARSPLVGSPDQEDHPLILDGARLYLQRHWAHQDGLASALHLRARARPLVVDTAWSQAALRRIFGPAQPQVDLQEIAAVLALTRTLSIITGGPGTGKTTTMVRILALLVDQARHQGLPVPRVMLLAPTGKAAARMQEAIAFVTAQPNLLPNPDELRAAIPATASTIHRQLGWQPRTPTRFRHDEDNPLAADVVVVDEASMVDISLFSKLVDAVPPDARLIMLGDRDQLASVEAGAVLADLAGPTTLPPPSHAFARVFGEVSGRPLPDAQRRPVPPIRDCIVELTRTHRFAADSGIDAVRQAVNAGDGAATLAILGEGRPDVQWYPNMGAAADVLEAAATELTPMVTAARAGDATSALSAMGRVRVLCAHRHGPNGVAAMNQLMATWLARHGGFDAQYPHAPGRPVMIRQNDPLQQLSNGDVGVFISVEGEPRVAFPPKPTSQTAAGAAPHEAAPRLLHPARLPPHETVFATTIHKSQGSEYARVVILLPTAPSPLLTRELLYTGITRAREAVTLVGSAAVIEEGVAARVQRASGLGPMLWGAGHL